MCGEREEPDPGGNEHEGLHKGSEALVRQTTEGERIAGDKWVPSAGSGCVGVPDVVGGALLSQLPVYSFLYSNWFTVTTVSSSPQTTVCLANMQI